MFLMPAELPGVDAAVGVRQHVGGRGQRGPRHRLHRRARPGVRRKNRGAGSNPISFVSDLIHCDQCLL